MAKIVAVTACPTGIAHTYMAAESLERAGKKQGIKVKVETNGSIGVENELSAKDIEEAVAVICAVDMRVKMRRFAGKPLIEVPVSHALKKADELIEAALNNEFKVYNPE